MLGNSPFVTSPSSTLENMVNPALHISACPSPQHPFSYRALLNSLILWADSDFRDMDANIYVPHRSILQRLCRTANTPLNTSRNLPYCAASKISRESTSSLRPTPHFLGMPTFSRHEYCLRQGASGSVSGVRSYPVPPPHDTTTATIPVSYTHLTLPTILRV